MDKHELSVWSKLYSIGNEILKMQPWQHICDTELFCIKRKDLNHAAYVNILGKPHKERETVPRQGIVIYANPVGVYGLSKMLDGYPVPKEQYSRYQDSLALFVGSENELTNFDRQIISNLGLNFDDGNVLYFRRYEYRYCTSVLNIDEAEIMLKLLKDFKFMLESYSNGNAHIDFSSCMLMLEYDDKDIPVLSSAPAKLEIGDSPYLHINNHELVDRLEKRPKVEAKIELDLCYLKKPIQDTRFKKPFYARVLLMTDADKKSVIINEPINPIEDEYGCLITALVKYIEKAGKPQVVFVRDGYISRALADTCKRLDIMLIISPKLPACDEIVKTMNAKFK